MINVDSVKEKIRQLLIEKDGDIHPHELKDIIIEAKQLGIDDRHIAKLLPELDRCINWEQIRKQKEELAIRQAESIEFAKNKELKKQDSQKLLETLLHFSFSGGVLEASEIETIFNKVVELSQNEEAFAKQINSQLKKRKYKPYPNPNLNAASLKYILLSTNWYDQKHYTKLTDHPPSTPKLLTLNKIIVIILIVGVIGFLFNNYKSKERQLGLKHQEIKINLKKVKKDSISITKKQELKKQKQLSEISIKKTAIKKEKEIKKDNLQIESKTLQSCEKITDNIEQLRFFIEYILNKKDVCNKIRINQDLHGRYSELIEKSLANLKNIIPKNKDTPEFINYCNLKNEFIFELKKCGKDPNNNVLNDLNFICE